MTVCYTLTHTTATQYCKFWHTLFSLIHIFNIHLHSIYLILSLCFSISVILLVLFILSLYIWNILHVCSGSGIPSLLPFLRLLLFPVKCFFGWSFSFIQYKGLKIECVACCTDCNALEGCVFLGCTNKNDFNVILIHFQSELDVQTDLHFLFR